jgi:hypothetical protein
VAYNLRSIIYLVLQNSSEPIQLRLYHFCVDLNFIIIIIIIVRNN